MFANSLGDDRYNYDDEALKKIMLENINEMIFYVIQTLDINNIPKENTDFSQNVEFDNNASIMHIKDFKYTNQNNNKNKNFRFSCEIREITVSYISE